MLDNMGAQQRAAPDERRVATGGFSAFAAIYKPFVVGGLLVAKSERVAWSNLESAKFSIMFDCGVPKCACD